LQCTLRLAANPVSGPLLLRADSGFSARSFLSRVDCAVWLKLVIENVKKLAIAVHAWVPILNHFHTFTPPLTNEGLSKMMQALDRSYVHHFNDS
jgi:hypothetical protein